MLSLFKRITLLFTLLVIFITAKSQMLPLPTPVSEKPTPDNLRPLSPPDLVVEEFSLLSVIRDDDAKKINVEVLIRIKNIGQLRSGNSTVLAYMKSPAGSGTERRLSTSMPISGINPGAAFVKAYTFREAESLFRPGIFQFWIKADGQNNVPESNETNNTSNILSIEKPVRR